MMIKKTLLIFSLLLLAGCASQFFYAQGRQALSLGQYQTALQSFTFALIENPQDPAALTGLGIVYYKTEAYEAAIQTLEEAKHIDPHGQETRLYLGLAYLKDGKDERATEELQTYAENARSRIGEQIKEALALLRKSGDSEAIRALVALNIEDWVRREQEISVLERRMMEATAFGPPRSGFGVVIRLR